MLNILIGVFWISCFLVIYPYIFYPLILLTVNLIFRRDNSVTSENNNDDLPKISMIVSAFNEEAVIEQKLLNSLNLDYPEGLFELIVVSDGSTDKTAEIVNQFAQNYSCVKLVEMPQQSGKSLGLNTAIRATTGSIVVFSDANAMYEYESLKQLVEPFHDLSVGYSVGSALYSETDTESVNVSEGLYWKYELWVKKLESEFFSVVGGDGAIYAIRAELFQPLDAADISDFLNPLQIVSKGYRGVFLPSARSFEGGTNEFSDEFRRKRRIVNRSWGAVRRNIGLFSMREHAQFLFMLISHKVIRWFGCGFILIALISGMAVSLLLPSAFFMFLTLGIILSMSIAIVGWYLDAASIQMPKMVYLIYFFYLVGVASSLGVLDELSGKRHRIWTPTR